MPWLEDDGFFSLSIPGRGERGEILTLWAMQRGPGRGWSAGIDDGATNTLLVKWDHFTKLEDAQRWCLMQGVECMKEGIAKLTNALAAL